MPDQDNADKDANKGGGETPAAVTDGHTDPPSGAEPQPPSAERSGTNNEQQESDKSVWHEIKILDVINTLIALGTLGTAIAAVMIASDTSDIKKAVRNISDLAIQTKRQANNSDSEVKTLAGEFGEMQKQTTALQGSSSASQGQLHEMRQEQQPQLAVAGVTPIDALKFDTGGALLRLNFNIRNVGKSTALYTDVRARFYARTNDAVVPEQVKACKKAPLSPIPVKEQGFNIIQGDTFPYPVWVRMGKDGLAIWQTPGKTPSGSKTYPIPMLVGCVQYTFGGVHHHTPFIYEVDRVAPITLERPNGYDSIDPTAGDVPVNQLVFPTPPWFMGRTD